MFNPIKTTARLLALLLTVAAIPQLLFAAGPAPVNLRSTGPFVILSGAGITSTGGGLIRGNVGASPIAGSAIGVTCAQVVGTIYAVDASGPPCALIDASLLTTAKGDLTTAYNDAAGRTPTPTGPNLNPGLIPGSGNIGGMVLAPGLYKFTTTALITGADVTLSGSADDVWIFQCAQDLQLGSGTAVILAGGAQAKNIFWQVGTSAVLGTFSTFKGTIIADQAITMNTSSSLEGRLLAFSAGIVFNGSSSALPTSPEIAVEQPLGVDIADGGTNHFGSVVAGGNKSLVFTIKNTGDADLTGLGITINGLDAASFSVTSQPVAPVAGPLGFTTFTVRFAPTTVGSNIAALHIANNDSNENPFDITLIGSGTAIPAPEIVVEQPLGVDVGDGGLKDFGSTVAGGNNSLVFTIKNTGDADLTGLGITIDGLDAGSFSVTANPIAPVSGPLGSTTFTVRFAPATLGPKAAALHIANNDSNENPFDITLTGSGTAIPTPEIAVEQPTGVDIADGGSKSFGSVVAGGNTSLIFTIKNTGTADLTGLGITIDGADAGSFSVTSNPGSPLPGPTGFTTFTVRFAPATVGPKVAALHIANNDSNENPFDISLTGSGTAASVPEIAVEQPTGADIPDGGSKSFGSVVAGGNTSLLFTIKNIGTADLTGLGITIDGLDASSFSVTSAPAAPVPGPFGFTTFTVRFAPTISGPKIAALHIANNDSNENPFDITLTGSGTAISAPEIAVEQPVGVDIVDGGSRDFGSVAFGSDTSLVFTIRNIGTADLTGLGITIDGADAGSFSVTSIPGAPVSGPVGFTTFTVRFAPTTVGPKIAALHIASNDSNENPFDITLMGTATGGLSVTSVSPITLNPQTGLFEQTVGVINLGSAVSSASRLQIQGLPEDVQVYNGSGFTNGIPFVQFNHAIVPGASVNLVVEYYRISRAVFATPAFEAVDTTPVTVTPAGIVIAVDRDVRLESGRFLIEFTTIPGRVYAIQYSSNLTSWVTVIPSVTAPSNKVQWYDDGPPKTESKPTTGSRFYQIIEMP